MVKFKFNNAVVKVSALSLVALTLLAAPAFARDGWERGHRGHGRGYDARGYRPHHEDGFFSVSSPSISFVFGRSRDRFCRRAFYHRHPREYVVVAPPPRVLISALPHDYQPVIINGVIYYTDNDVYYQYTSQGYVVVPRPAPAVFETARADTAFPASPIKKSEEFISVNVPNKKGGYLVVDIKRTDNGYIGPQGEFYPEFPRVDQLKVMYGK